MMSKLWSTKPIHKDLPYTFYNTPGVVLFMYTIIRQFLSPRPKLLISLRLTDITQMELLLIPFVDDKEGDKFLSYYSGE